MPRTITDLVYARTSGPSGERDLTLDLYFPDNSPGPLPLIVWIHGGAFRMGDKTWCQEILPMLSHGYAIASIDYRLSQEAVFPAQIRDVKAAVRWLRLHAGEWDLDPERFASAGSSAGGHLAALLGGSFYKRVWDQSGAYLECAPEAVSSAVQAVVDWYGPTDFLRMNAEPGDQDHFAPDSPESELLGSPILDIPERVAEANPASYAYPGFPAFLLLHGDHDRLVLPNQSILLRDALAKVGSRASLFLIPGAGHGFNGGDYELALEKTAAFLDRELRQADLRQNFFYACTEETFRPRTRHAVRWLNPHTDYDLARAYWNLKPGNDLTVQTWLGAHDMGYSYAAVVEEENSVPRIVSTAAAWRFSGAAWELSAVSTLAEEYRQKGCATSVSSFVTSYILGAGRIATCSTSAANTAMQKTAEGIGYLRAA